MNVRRADGSDVAAVQRISAEAYIPAYQAICGFVPKPAFGGPRDPGLIGKNLYARCNPMMNDTA
jgi:hypothetical protein